MLEPVIPIKAIQLIPTFQEPFFPYLLYYTSFTMSVECPCPYCPLVENNVQVCNVIVRLLKDNCYCSNLPDEYKHIAHNFIVLSLHHKNNLKLKKGYSHTIEKDDYHYTVERIGNTAFKVCFHAKTVE
jgi:hypothetical protein